MIGLMFAAALLGSGFQNDEIGVTQREIALVCAHSPKIEIVWDAFGADADGRSAFLSQGLSFLRTAMKEVCADVKRKAAFKAQVAGIVISQAYGAADPYIYMYERRLHVEYLWVKGEPGPDAKFVASEIASRLRGEAPAPP